MKAALVDILVCTQAGLLDSVLSDLRQATIEPMPNDILLHMEYAGKRTDLKEHLSGFATSGINPHTGEGVGPSEVYSSHDAFSALPGYPVFRRFESEERSNFFMERDASLPSIEGMDLSEYRFPFETRALLTAQRALLDCVHRDLRTVTLGIEEEKKGVVLFATYENEPDELRRTLIELATSKMKLLLPSANTVSMSISVLSQAEGKPRTPGRYAFARYEGWLKEYGYED